MNSTDDPRKHYTYNGEKKHSKHASWHVRIRTEWNPFRLARKAERRGYEKGHTAGHAEGLREGYSSRVKDEVAARWHGTIRAREFNDQKEEQND